MSTITLYYFVNDEQRKMTYDTKQFFSYLKRNTFKYGNFGTVCQLPLQCHYFFCTNINALQFYSNFVLSDNHEDGGMTFCKLSAYTQEQIDNSRLPSVVYPLPSAFMDSFVQEPGAACGDYAHFDCECVLPTPPGPPPRLTH